MPAPSSSLATPRLDLGRSLEAIDLAEARQGFIGNRIMPIFEAARSGGEFGVIPIEQLLACITDNIDRGPRGGYSEGDWVFEPMTFHTRERGHVEKVSDNDKANYRDYFDAELVSAARALDICLRQKEVRVAAAVFNATTFTSYTTGITHEWDDATNAVPRADVKAAKKAVFEQCGLHANALIINYDVFENAIDCDSIIDRIKYQNRQDARPVAYNEAALAAALNIDQVIVAGSPKNVAKEGQDVDIEQIWDPEYAMVCRIAMTNDLTEPCIGRTFHWGGDGSMPDCIIEEYRWEDTRSDKIRARHQVQEKMIMAQCGHLLSNATTI